MDSFRVAWPERQNLENCVNIQASLGGLCLYITLMPSSSAPQLVSPDAEELNAQDGHVGMGQHPPQANHGAC